jgi:excisionase family DNA binding protein
MPPASPLDPSPTPAREGVAVFYSIASLAARWGVCERTVRRLIGSGKLKAHGIGGQIRIAEEDAEAFLQFNIVSRAIPKNRRK